MGGLFCDLKQKAAKPRERSIIFSAPMVRAILAGIKTQTRRIIKAPPGGEIIAVQSPVVLCSRGDKFPDGDEALMLCPYGSPGDRLWVRETWHPCDGGDLFRADYDCENDREMAGIERWISPIYMPRSCSRITLEITNVRATLLQSINEVDANAEGIQAWIESYRVLGYYHQNGQLGAYPVTAYSRLWDEINGKTKPWASNPWVWAISFRRISGGAR